MLLPLVVDEVPVFLLLFEDREVPTTRAVSSDTKYVPTQITKIENKTGTRKQRAAPSEAKLTTLISYELTQLVRIINTVPAMKSLLVATSNNKHLHE